MRRTREKTKKDRRKETKYGTDKEMQCADFSCLAVTERYQVQAIAGLDLLDSRYLGQFISRNRDTAVDDEPENISGQLSGRMDRRNRCGSYMSASGSFQSRRIWSR